MKIGNELKKIRKEKGLGLKELANISGVSITEINNLELNKHEPSAKTLFKLSKALNIDVEYLYELGDL